MLAHRDSILFVRGCTQRVCSAQAVCSLAGPRSIKSIPGRFLPRPQAPPSFSMLRATLKNWEEPGDEARSRGGRTCSRASVEEFNLMSEFCYFSLFWLDYGRLKKLHTANGNSSTHADWAHAF